MKRTVWMLALTLAVGITVGTIGTQVLNAQYAQQQEPIKRTVLLKTDLAGLEGQEANGIMAEVAPGAREGKHYHPGHTLVYVLSGAGTLEMEGKPPVAIKPGVTFYIPPKQVHEGIATSSGFKAVAFFIIPKGQPITVPVK